MILAYSSKRSSIISLRDLKITRKKSRNSETSNALLTGTEPKGEEKGAEKIVIQEVTELKLRHI